MNPFSRLIQAVREHDMETFLQMIAQDITLLSQHDNQGRTLFMMACAHGTLEMVRKLGEHLVDGSLVDRAGNNAFYYAIDVRGQVDAEIIKVVYAMGADVALVHPNGDTPLEMLIGAATRRNNDLEDIMCVRFLIQFVDIPCPVCFLRRVMRLDVPNDLIIVLLAYYRGINVNLSDGCHDDQSLLHTAVDIESKNIVTVLYQLGVNINVVDAYGYTPLMESICSDREEIAFLLIGLGADVTIVNHLTGKTVKEAAEEMYMDELVNAINEIL